MIPTLVIRKMKGREGKKKKKKKKICRLPGVLAGLGVGGGKMNRQNTEDF